MIHINYLLWFLYSLLLAWDLYSTWGTPTAWAWATAAAWFFFWALDTVLERRRMKRMTKSHIADMWDIAETAMKGTGSLVKFLNGLHDKERRRLEQRIWELEGTLKTYDRNAKKDAEGTATKKRSR